MAKSTKKVAKTLKKVLKKTLKNSQSRNGYAANQGRLLFNGVAAAPRKPWGTRSVGLARNITLAKSALNALIPRTLGLPRAVGPYTVIRTTAQFSWPKDCRMVVFVPVIANRSEGPYWLSCCGFRQTGADTDAVSAPGSVAPILMPVSELGEASEVCPASMTVQCMNGKNLQNADGIFFATRINQQLELGMSTKTWGELRSQIISYFSPRILASTKLALRGVTSHSYPLNMNEYSEFLPRSNLIFTQLARAERPSALAPIVFIRDTDSTETTTDLSFLITMEWRTRFDPLNPAAASHTYHEVTSDNTWNNVIKSASAEGHGIIDTVEDISLMGALGAGARTLGSYALPAAEVAAAAL